MLKLAHTNSVFESNADVLSYHARVINTFLSRDDHFPNAEAYERQTLALIEEVGECVGAGRRYLGMARRNGTLEDLGLELADVVIATHVYADILGVELIPAGFVLIINGGNVVTLRRSDSPLPMNTLPRRTTTVVLFIEMGRALNAVVDKNDAESMNNLIRLAQAVAHVVEIDLPHVVNTKLDKIYTRGWKDGEHSDQPALFNETN